ncbi:hypothetical protein GF356_10705 [candidate division GN15 bacterium]|nr:hypothetical protein [candidate division GN15 bacterium]
MMTPTAPKTTRNDVYAEFRNIIQQSIATSAPKPVKDEVLQKPIIIGGCGSSGTTLLKTILDSHRNIACGQEVSFFDRPVLYRTKLKDLHRMYLQQDFRALDSEQIFPIQLQYNNVNISYMGLCAPCMGRTYHDFATTNKLFEMARDTRHFVHLYFSNYAIGQGKRRWAEKTPNNCFCVGEVLDFLDDAKFVHVVRDGRDVVLSLVERRDSGLPAAVFRWVTAVEAARRHEGNPRYYQLKYEDLVTEPERTLRDLMEFVEEEFDPGMLDFTRSGQNNPLGYGQKPISAKNVGRWRSANLDYTAVRTMDLCMRHLLEKLGYEVDSHESAETDHRTDGRKVLQLT